MKLRTSILLVFMMLTVCIPAWSQKEQPFDKSRIRLSWNRDKITLYNNEPTVLTLYLWTPQLEVRGIRQTKAPLLDKGKFSYLNRTEINTAPQLVEKDGETWYVYPVDSYAVAMDSNGKYKLRDGRYLVDFAVRMIVNDPFWGKVQTTRTEQLEVPVSPLDLTIKALPQPPVDSEFSGAVGNFKVTVDVPPGDIYLNEEATAIITVKGAGWLNDNTLPEYHEAFGKGVKLKSFSEHRTQYIQDGELVSELSMECQFIPTDKDAEIGAVRIETFNPMTGVYENIESDPVKVKVSSIAKKAPVLDI